MKKLLNLRPLLLTNALLVLAISSLTLISIAGCQGQAAQENVNQPVVDEPLAIKGEGDLLALAPVVATVNTVIDLDGSNFGKIIENGVVLVDFWATWCAPCRRQLPIIEELAAEIGNKAVISKLDVDKNRALAQQFNVRSVPTLLIFKDGKIERTFMGVTPKQTLLAAINELL